MDLDDLAIFQAVIREGGITRAAEKLHRVQSNVTTRIRQLEDDLGVPLFVREGKKLIPSPAGRVLEDYARRLLELAAEARGAVAGTMPRGRLRLGAMESTAASRLAPVLAAFHGQYEGVQLELRTGATAGLVAEVLDGTLDCALVAGPVVDPRLTCTPVFEEELVAVAAADHPPVKRAADLKIRNLLTFESGCAYRQRLESWLASEGLVPERFIELSSYHAMIGCAACGMGVALVPRSLLACLPAADNVSVHALPPTQARTTTVLVQRSGVPAPTVAAFLALLPDLGEKAEALDSKRERPALAA
jgi:DNA-binding transcriptional LysR family regulator